MMFFTIFIVLLFFRKTSQQFQQCSFLAGESTINSEPSFESTEGELQEINIGGISGTTSILTSRNSEILIFFGTRKEDAGHGDYDDYYVNDVWKFSLEKKVWKFLKGFKCTQSYGCLGTPVFNTSNLGVFEENNEIGIRTGSKGWKNYDENGHEIITFFGGKATTIVTDYYVDYSNEMWRYNVSSNQYAVILYNKKDDWDLTNIYGRFSDYETYKPYYHPSGRTSHEMVKLNENEVLLLGGYGYYHTGEQPEREIEISDWWIFSMQKMEWKIMGYGNNVVRGTVNVYSAENRMGQRKGLSATLINEEEVLIFGGYVFPNIYTNILQKYNVSSNMFKYIQGEVDSELSYWYGNGYTREYSSENSPGARIDSQMLKLNDEEVLIFGGYGYESTGSGYLNSEWRFNTINNQFKFTGKESTKIHNRLLSISSYSEYSEDDLMGGMIHFFMEYIADTKEIIIGTGYGYGLTSRGSLSDVFRIYIGNICYDTEDKVSNVCSGFGKCSDYNNCDCNEGRFGDQCELSKCFNILSNETDSVCSRNGICNNSICDCYEYSIYTLPDCSIDLEKQQIDEEYQDFLNNLWIYILIPVSICSIIIVCIVIFIIAIFLFFKLKKTTKKFEGIEDIDLILEEAKLEQNSKTPKIKINKALFEIEYKDLKLISILGEGGSDSTIFLCKWKNAFCAFKKFKCFEMTTTLNSYEEFEKEVKIYSSINHPNILRFYGACINLPNVGIILEFCKQGDLAHYLQNYQLNHNGNQLSKLEKLRILKEISFAMNYLHKINILHRDLKPENVLIDDNNTCKIMDFGISKLLTNEVKTMTKKIGTSFYMAPEVLLGKHYSSKCDVFSFAILVYVILTENFLPYGNDTHDNNILKRVSKSPNYRPTINENSFKNCKFLIPLITKNWNENPETRNSFEEIMKILETEETKLKELDEKRNRRKFLSKKKEKSEMSRKELEDIISKQEKRIKDLEKKVKELTSK